MRYEEAATFLRTALLLGLITPEEVITWADRALHEDPSPPGPVYTVALSAPELSAIREALRPLAFPAETPAVIASVLGVAARELVNGKRNVDDTLRVLSQFRRFVKLPPDLDDEIKVLDAQHMLAVAGVTDQLETVQSRVRILVDRYLAVPPLAPVER